MARLFAAVPASPELRAEAARILSELKGSGADVSWSDPAQAHLTLHFFGEVPDERRPAAEAVLAEAAGETPPFRLALGPCGAFPSVERPRVVWLGLSEGAQALGVLASRLRERLAAGGWPVEERPFRAHLTLGRVRSGRGAAALAGLLGRLEGRAAMLAGELALYRSRLGSAGPAHEVLRGFPLGGAA